jgi:protein subunit release factor A
MALPESLERLARQCVITPFKSSGPGGQKKNKTESSVRVRHLPSGITRIATESRSQARNRVTALERVALALERRAHRPKPRKTTKPSRGAVEKRIATKRIVSEKKRVRRAPDDD